VPASQNVGQSQPIQSSDHDKYDAEMVLARPRGHRIRRLNRRRGVVALVDSLQREGGMHRRVVRAQQHIGGVRVQGAAGAVATEPEELRAIVATVQRGGEPPATAY
jgi:hypothetical protein